MENVSFIGGTWKGNIIWWHYACSYMQIALCNIIKTTYDSLYTAMQESKRGATMVVVLGSKASLSWLSRKFWKKNFPFPMSISFQETR